MAAVDILMAIKRDDAARYHENLKIHEGFQIQVCHSIEDALGILSSGQQHVDILVVDNRLDRAFASIAELRQTYPRLLIVLVDEEADFGMPGQADEFSTDPFKNDDLARRIRRLMSDRQMETLRSDSLPTVRNFAKQLRAATGLLGKQQAAVQACKDMGYDYVAYYHKDTDDPLRLILRAQAGPAAIQAIAPKESSQDDLIGWVFLNGQSRMAGPEDRPNHPLVLRGRLGAVACVPVTFNGVIYGVAASLRDRPGSITQENVIMLELIGSQLAAAMSKER